MKKPVFFLNFDSRFLSQIELSRPDVIVRPGFSHGMYMRRLINPLPSLHVSVSTIYKSLSDQNL